VDQGRSGQGTEKDSPKRRNYLKALLGSLSPKKNNQGAPEGGRTSKFVEEKGFWWGGEGGELHQGNRTAKIGGKLVRRRELYGF